MLINFSNPVKGAPGLVTLDKSALFALSAVQSDAYFSNQMNVSRALFVFEATGGQMEVLNFDLSNETPSDTFSLSSRARDSFLLKRVILEDFDGGSLVVDRTELPAGLDIAAISETYTGAYNNGRTYSPGESVLFSEHKWVMVLFIGAAGYSPAAPHWFDLGEFEPEAEGPTSGTVFLAHFDGSSVDSSGFGLSGVSVAGPVGSPIFVPGKFGSAISVNGGRVEYQLTTQADFGSDDFTIEFFAKGDTPGTALLTVGAIAANGAISGGFHVSINYQGLVHLKRENVASLELNESWNWGPWGPFRGIDSVWRHIAIVRQGTSLTVYYDGGRGHVNTIPAGLIFGSAGKVLSVGSGKQVDGGHYAAIQPGASLLIDELRITKGTALYSGQTITPPTAPF